MYAVATGWLGWPPEVAWHTPLPELFLALDARIEWQRITSPFGSGTGAPPKPKLSVAERLKSALRGRVNKSEA